MSKYTWLYLWAVLIAAVVLTVVAQIHTHEQANDLISIAIWIVLGIYGQFFEVKVRGSRHSYYPHLVPFFVGVVLLPPYALFLVVAIPHAIEWFKKQLDGKPYVWYVQPFNIASHVVAGIIAQQVFLRLGGTLDFSQFTLQSTLLAVLSAITVYAVINHLLIGQILAMARQISWAESGVMELEDLMTDGVTMTLGYISALLWSLSPWLLPLIIAPFVMLYRALQVPELEKKANTDEKTGLWNASHFNQILQNELTSSEQNRRTLSVIMADLDFLRTINNTYGHLAGDAVIAGIGAIIRKTVRKQDTASRFGGEEYAILLPNTSREQAVVIAERIRQSVAETPFHCNTVSEPLHASMSLGVACYPEDADSVETLIYEADVALYQAKIQGRNRVIQSINVPRSIKVDAADALTEKRGKLPPVSGQPPTVAVVSKPVETKVTPTNGAGTQADVAAEVTLPSMEQGQPSSVSTATAHTEQTVAQPLPKPLSVPQEKDVAGANQPSPWLWLFIEGVILFGLLIAILSFLTTEHFAWEALMLFGVLAFGVQWLQFSLYEKSSVSSAVAIVFAAAMVTGAPGVIVSSSVIAIVHFLHVRSQLYKALFNWATHVLAGMAPVILVYQLQNLFEINVSVDAIWVLIPGVSMAVVLYFVVETGLVASAIALSEGLQLRVIWKEQFGWLLLPYVVLSLLGLFLALSFLTMGVAGVLIYLLPLLGMHSIQRMYVDRTQSSVRELRRMNAELAEANQQVMDGKASIEQMNQELLLTLSRIIDARDPFVSGHASKVAEYARAIAQHLQLSESQIDAVYQAGLLHDIGKIGIPERILLKPGSLTDEEYEIVKQHTVLGADFLSTSHALQHLAPVIRSHHEQWNGQGYPAGLLGEEIPLPARILSVCDAVEAMASDRPYQRNKPFSVILSELERCSGQQFDPAVVAAFLEVVQAQPHLVGNSALEVMQAHSRLNESLYAKRVSRWNGKPQLLGELT